MFIAYEASTINDHNLAAIKDKLSLDAKGWDAALIDTLNNKEDLYCIIFNFFESIQGTSCEL